MVSTTSAGLSPPSISMVTRTTDWIGVGLSLLGIFVGSYRPERKRAG